MELEWCSSDSVVQSLAIGKHADLSYGWEFLSLQWLCWYICPWSFLNLWILETDSTTLQIRWPLVGVSCSSQELSQSAGKWHACTITIRRRSANEAQRS